MADVFAKVRKVIEGELGRKEEEIHLESTFVEDLGADSLDLVELVMHLEEEFSIQIPDDDVEKLKTVGDAVNYIQKKLDEAA